MRKHLLFFAFVLVLIAVLSACGAKKEDAAMVEKTPSATVAPTASEAGTTDPASTETAQEVKLIASAVTFKYDQEEYHVKKGVPVNITLEMKDGNHGARLADFDVNLSADTPTATFTPTEAGTFEIKCSVNCGSGHMNMTAKLIVE
jgi:cytochrome c oxidase subunit 2